MADNDIQGFMNISGCNDAKVAKMYLDMFPGDMNNAINEYFSNLGNESWTSGNDGGDRQVVNNGEEDVRTPIPSFNDQLIPDDDHLGISGLNHFSRINSLSSHNMSSAIEDFSTHMFSPPKNIMFNQPFEAAKEVAKSQGKLIMVNIQSPQEFTSMVLNRDIWNDSLMIEFIQEHFIFWQRGCNTPEGSEWLAVYGASKLPHVSVIDPRTGRQLKSWDVEKSFSDSISASSEIIEFLESENALKTIRRISSSHSLSAASSSESTLVSAALPENPVASVSCCSASVATASHSSASSAAAATPSLASGALSSSSSSVASSNSNSLQTTVQVEVPRMNSELALLHMERMKRKNSGKK